MTFYPNVFVLEMPHKDDWYISLDLSFWFIFITIWICLVIPLSNDEDSVSKSEEHGDSQDERQVCGTSHISVMNGTRNECILLGEIVDEGYSCTSSEADLTDDALSTGRTSINGSSDCSEDEREVLAGTTKPRITFDSLPIRSVEAEIVVDRVETTLATSKPGVSPIEASTRIDLTEEPSKPKNMTVSITVPEDTGRKPTSSCTPVLLSLDSIQDSGMTVSSRGVVVLGDEPINRGNAKMWLSGFKLVDHHNGNGQVVEGDKVIMTRVKKDRSATVCKVLVPESSFQKELRRRMSLKPGMPRQSRDKEGLPDLVEEER